MVEIDDCSNEFDFFYTADINDYEVMYYCEVEDFEDVEYFDEDYEYVDFDDYNDPFYEIDYNNWGYNFKKEWDFEGDGYCENYNFENNYEDSNVEFFEEDMVELPFNYKFINYYDDSNFNDFEYSIFEVDIFDDGLDTYDLWWDLYEDVEESEEIFITSNKSNLHTPQEMSKDNNIDLFSFKNEFILENNLIRTDRLSFDLENFFLNYNLITDLEEVQTNCNNNNFEEVNEDFFIDTFDLDD